MLVAKYGEARQREMGGGGGGYRHGLDVRIVDQLPRILVHADRRPRAASLFPRAFADVRDRYDIKPRVAGKRPQEVLTPIAVTTEPEFDHAHGVSLAALVLSAVKMECSGILGRRELTPG